MNNNFWKWGFFFAALSVVLGAFGAHGLKTIFPPDSLAIYETAVRYQFYHAFAIIITALLIDRIPGRKMFTWAGRSFIWGTLLFSGSLYVLAPIKAGRLNLSESVGLITPIGGLLFILGWSFLLIAAFRK